MSSITLWGAVYDTNYVDLPKTGGGTVRFSEGGGDEPSGPTYVNIIPEQTFTPSADYTAVTFTELLVAGETYRYIVNGVEKTGVAADFYGSIVLGSYSDYNSGTGGAFECVNGAVYYDTKLRTSHTVQVDRVVEGSSGGGGSSSSNPLKGKIASFTGDSLCAGAGYTGGYAGIIGTDYDMTVENIGTSEGTIVRYQSYFCISESISSMRSDADFVMLEGGGNDAWYGTSVIPLGTLSSGYSATLDTTTFAGAFENMLKSAIARFPNAKIGYIFPHKCIANFDMPSGAYHTLAISALEKWGIPYLDLNIMTPPLGYIDDLKSTYTAGDGIHPNEAGYRTFYVPKIVAFMQSMLTDKTLINKTVTTNGTYLASDDDADGYSSVTVSVSGGGGLDYEEGTYTAASNSNPTISFSNSHNTAPAVVIFVDSTGEAQTTSNRGTVCVLGSISAVVSGGVPYSGGTADGIYAALYHGSSADSGGGGSRSPISNNLTASGFTPFFGTSGRTCQSGRTYKWLAVWR